MVDVDKIERMYNDFGKRCSKQGFSPVVFVVVDSDLDQHFFLSDSKDDFNLQSLVQAAKSILDYVDDLRKS